MKADKKRLKLIMKRISVSESKNITKKLAFMKKDGILCLLIRVLCSEEEWKNIQEPKYLGAKNIFD